MTEELFHIRCITCGKVLSRTSYIKKLEEQGLEVEKLKYIQDDKQSKKVLGKILDDLGIKRYCCRTRMMNPFKVISNVDRQFDPDLPEEMLNKNFENLTIATHREAPSTGSLDLMNLEGMTIVPEEDEDYDMDLPDIPSISFLPGNLDIGGNVVKSSEGRIRRIHDAR